MNHAAGEVRSFAEERVADDIEIGVAGEAESGAESQAAGFFDIGKKFERVADANSGVDGDYARGGGLVYSAYAVNATVEGGKRGMRLENEIGLAREPELGVLKVRENGFDVGRH